MIAQSVNRGGVHHAVVARVVVASFGSLAMAWALFTTPIFWRQSVVERTEKHIIAGDLFKPSAMASLRPTFAELGHDKWARPAVLGAVAVISLRLIEQAIIDDDKKNIDVLMIETGAMIRRALASAPADPFLWTVLFWLENTQNGFTRARLKLLQMSYWLGPNEGWIAIKRNRFALAIFPVLPSDISEKAVVEFANLVDSKFFDEAADILLGPGWPIRETLLSGLKDVDEVNRQTFAKFIYKLGYDVSVPGVERPEWRPWH